MYIDPDHRTGYHRSSFIVFIMAFILAFSGEDAMSGVQSDFYGHIVIGGDKNYPPFEYLDDGGRPAGFIVDISRAIGREVGLEIFFRLGTWAQVVDELESGRVDVLQGMFYSPERDLKYDFTQAHSVNNYVMVVRNGERKIPTSLAELADLHIVVQKSDIMHDFALKNKLGRPLSVEESPERALRELAGGRYDCALMARIPTLYLIRKNGWTDFVLGKKPILTTQYCYAVANNNRALLAQFSEGLKIIEENGEYRRIYEKWLGTYQAPYPDFLTIVGYVSMAAVPLILLALLFFLWSWSLRKQVANRTLALARREKQYRLLADNTLDVIWTMNLDFEFTYVNPSIAELTGYSPGEWTGTCLSDHCDEDNFIRITRGIAHAMSRGKRDAGTIFDVGILKKEGGTIWAEIHGKIIYDETDTPVGLQGVARDVSERKRNEQRIDHLNKVLRAMRDVNQLIVHKQNATALIHQVCRLLVDNRGFASAVMVLTDHNDKPVAWGTSGIAASSQALLAMLQAGEVPLCCPAARSAGDMVLMDQYCTACRQCPITKRNHGIISMCVELDHDGRSFGYLVAALDQHLHVDKEEKTLFKEMAQDLAYALYVLESDAARKASEEKQQLLESQLAQARKMESVGRLAGGVAHDYNNMLGIIIGYAEMGQKNVASDDLMYSYLEAILSAARRSTDITRQLLAFARKQTIDPKVLDLNDTLESMLKMVRRLIGEDIELVWQPGTGVWAVKMDPSQVDQILVNLCVNARDAIAGVGKITIETKNVCFDGSYCRDHAGFVPGEYIVLAVSDDGTGMSPETMENVFEPFFTTKEPGKGTGLGLATVYGIVKQNQGFINVYTELEKGSTIRIYLPRHLDGGLGETIAPAVETPLGHGEKLLLVEDDGAILDLCKQMLENMGYTVWTAGSPGAALALAGDVAHQIELLITDVVMPDMNGRDLAGEFLAMNADLKILFMSGYTANVIGHRGVLDEGVNFIAKPFSQKELGIKVREILDN